MDTFAEIKVICADKIKAKKAINIAFKRIKEIETLLNKFDSDSELAKLNNTTGSSIKVSNELFYCVEKALEFSKITGGAFDITVQASAPFEIGWENIVLNRENQTITLTENSKIDLGGIAKGFAVDEAVKILKQFGIEEALVNLGGNIYCLKKNKEWNVGLQSPVEKNKIIGSIKLENQAVATSGTYERFNHIINPETGEPVKGDILSVSIIAPSAIASDAFSTGMFVLGFEKARNLIEKLENVEAIIITTSALNNELDIWVSGGINGKINISQLSYNRIW